MAFLNEPGAAPFAYPKAPPQPAATNPAAPNTGSVLGDLGQWAAGFHPDAGLTGHGPNGFATAGGQLGGIGAIRPFVTPSAPVAPPGPDATNWQGGTQVPGAAPAATATASAALNPFDGDPGYAAAHAAETLGIPTISGDLQNQIARRLTQWGDASFANQAGFGMDPQAAAFARQNYLTGNADLARLDHSHQLARQAIINRLAGHGLLFSGDTGYQTGQEDQNYGNQVYDGQQKVLGDLYGYQTGALGQKQSLRAATVAAMENAFMNAANHPGLYGDGTQSALASAPETTKKVAVPKATRSAIVNQLRWQR